MQNFQDNNISIKYVNKDNVFITYLKELYDIMNKYGISRIYHINNKNEKDFKEAHQSLSVFIVRDSMLLTKIIQLIKKYFPIIYFKIILNFRLYRYRYKLKKLSEKYDILQICTNSFSLYEGIAVNKHQIYMNKVQVVFKSGIVYYIDKLYVEI